jgi:dTDP-4-amino-4,6-dideoxygalactose transaminase
VIIHALESHAFLMYTPLNFILTFARHMFHVIMLSAESRHALISHLARFGILPVFHHLLLDLSPMGLRFGGCQGGCPVTEDLADRLVRLPFFTGVSSSEQAQTIDAVRAFRCKAR